MIPCNISPVIVKFKHSSSIDILMQCCIHFAEQGINVWFISPEPFKEFPRQLKPADKEILKTITFLYLTDQKDLLSHLNGIHLWHKSPQLIILNGLEHYSKALTSVNSAAFICASLLDATSVCASKHSGNKAYLLVACTLPSNDEPVNLDTIMKLYFSVVLDENEKVFNEIISAFKI